MADQEVIKHTKKVFSIWGSKHGFWHKLREFILEIFIIVFAISLSIYLHDRSVLRHQHHETKEFLLGLKEDLATDTTEMGEDRESFVKSGQIFNYISRVKKGALPSKDTLNKYSRWIFNTTGLVPNSGRFEGFKSAGKVGTIENKKLQNDIMDLYQEDIPNLILSTNNYTMIKQRLFEYIYKNKVRITDSTSNMVKVMPSEEVFNISYGLLYVDEILQRYDLCLRKMKLIIAEIDKEYGKGE